ncbi:MAG: hypothetical protein RMJ82_12715 [Gemmatales bacterium]|nr:hypothetical protein [Gemmatales bacterium]
MKKCLPRASWHTCYHHRPGPLIQALHEYGRADSEHYYTHLERVSLHRYYEHLSTHLMQLAEHVAISYSRSRFLE